MKIDQIKRIPAFEEWPALGQKLNEMIDGINARTPSPGFRTRIRFTETGFTVEANPRGIGAPTDEGLEIQRFKIEVNGQDAVICRKYLEDLTLDTSEELFLVAKPQVLRGVDPRTTNFGTGSIVEKVYPPYTIGTDIYAVKDPIGGTGLESVVYHEISPGRIWRPDYKEVCVKVNNVEMKMIVLGSDPF